LGFGVWGFRVWGLGFRVWFQSTTTNKKPATAISSAAIFQTPPMSGTPVVLMDLGFRVSGFGLGFRVSGFGFVVLIDLGFRISGFGFRVCGIDGFRV
jgi:hypothetical protein